MTKYRRTAIWLAAFALVLVPLFAALHAQAEQLPPHDGLIVRLEQGVSTSALSLERFGEVAREVNVQGLHYLVVHPHADTQQTIQSIERVPGVAYVEPNHIITLEDSPTERLSAPAGEPPTDPLYLSGYQWWMYATGRAFVDQVTIGVTLGQIDSGCDVTHEDLPPITSTNRINVTEQGDRDDVTDTNGHGTHVWGIMGMVSNNGKGGLGIASSIRQFVCIKAFMGGGTTYDMVVRGLVEARLSEVEVLNVSFGGPSNKLLEEGVKFYLDQGDSFLIAACGNASGVTCTAPANLPLEGVVAVSALNGRLEKPDWSNAGPEVMFSQPGADICSTLPDSAYGCLSGTSMATPNAAAWIAATRTQHRTLSRTDFLELLQGRAQGVGDEGQDDETGYGMLTANVVQ